MKILKFNLILAALMAFFAGCSSGDGGDSAPVRKSISAASAQGKILLYSGSSDTTGTEYSTLSAAWAVISTSSTDTYKIVLEKGTYDLGKGQLAYNGSATVVISGQGGKDADGTLNYGLDCLIKSSMTNNGSASEQARSLISFKGSGNLILENVTLRQCGTSSGDNQLETIGYDGTGYVAAYNCSFLSHQDTLRTTGKAWFYGCYVEGDVDFLWMETSGLTALYEKCILCAVGDRTSRAYLTAPRSSSSASTIYKGLVVFNSEIWVDGIDTYLGRNPWSKNPSSYYNNVAFVGTKNTKGSVNSAFYSDCNRSSSVFITGYNVDSNFKNATGAKTLSAEQIAAEYAGRKNILNRCSNTSGTISKDTSAYWDVNALASTMGWTVVTDSSSAE